MSSSSIRQVRVAAIERLSAAGVPDPEVETELLLTHLLGLSRGQVQAKLALEVELVEAEYAEFERLLNRRCAREPLQHITGRAPFRRLSLAVGPGVFVPRPETELTTQVALDALANSASPEPVAVDLGTGSGAIAISIAVELAHSRVLAIEKSTLAYEWALKNATEANAPNLQIELGDLAECFPALNGLVDLVVSNPPYIPTGAIPRDPEVRLFDPEEALYGGSDGLDVVRVVSKVAQRLLRPGGTLVVEHGEAQGEAIRNLFQVDGWRGPSTIRDLLGRDRVSTAIR